MSSTGASAAASGPTEATPAWRVKADAILARLDTLAAPAAWAALLLGVVLRVAQYASGRSLWLDEAMLALNILHRSPWELVTRQLDYTQGAPVGFLLLAKLATWVLGPSDAALRLIPLLGGIAGLFLIWGAARRILPGFGPLIALTLFAVSERPIYFASEVKQYSTDGGIALVLLLGGLWVLESGLRPRALVTLGAVGAVALWTSHPALFVLAGTGLGIGAAALRPRDRARLPWVGLMLAMWAASLGAVYFVSLRGLAANAGLLDYWKGTFLPTPLLTSGPWLVQAVARFLWNPCRLPHIALGAVLLLIGSVTVARVSWPAAIMLLLPFPAVLAASALHKYPFGDRLLLFLVPAVCLLIAAGCDGVRRLLGAYSAPLAVVAQLTVAAVMLYEPTFSALYRLKHPITREELKPVMAYLREHRLPSDDVFVYDGAMYAFLYYAPRYGFQSADYRTGVCVRQHPEECAEALRAVTGHRRVWFVFSHEWSDHEPQFQSHLDELGSRLEEFTAPGASAMLYDLGTHPAAGTSHRHAHTVPGPPQPSNPTGPV